MFFPGSRYEMERIATHTNSQGGQIVYVLLRRIPLPPPDRVHMVEQGDRLDLLSATYYDDPEQHWRISDANLAFDSRELVQEPGRRLVIPIQER